MTQEERDDLDGTAPIASDAALEAEIAANPDDVAPYLVYADFLQSRGDPRGELIVAHHRSGARAGQLLREHERYWLGGLAPHYDIVDVTWKLGFIESARVHVRRKHEDAGIAQAPLLRTLLALPSARFLRTLEVGLASIHEDGVSEAIVAALVAGGPRPTLRSLRFFFDREEEMMSWTATGNLAPLWPLVPNLTSLCISSGMIALGPMELPALETLTISTCGLARENVIDLCESSLPVLRELELWFGDPERGATADIGSAQALLQSEHLYLESLGLVNTAFTDELCELLVDAPLLGQLARLDLSKGTLTDAGARTLAAVLPDRAPNLAKLDVRDCYLSPDGIAALTATGIDVIVGEQREAELYEGKYHRYVDVTE